LGAGIDKPQTVRACFKRCEGQLAISSVTVMELLCGAEKSQELEHNLRVIEGFIARLDVLDYDTHAAAHTGQIRAELGRIGRPIGPYDSMIGGHARSRALVL
jgi:tRNA(fMet)-specific endonuclease VapC